MEIKTCIILNIVFVSASARVYPIDNSLGLGRRFDGIGAISGGGATSKLLVNYPEIIRDQILDYLFKPNFGASLHILKVEIGGDACSTDGSEASHMHESWDENYERGYEWWLMTEAKKRNPAIRLYGLPWAFPGWVGGSTRKHPWSDPNRTAGYVLNWIRGARDYHNLTIDYIGIWNEKHYNIEYIKILRELLDGSGFANVKIVAADIKWEIADDILNDTELSAAVENVGCHYPGTFSSPSAMQTGKALWASEDYSTYNDNVGGGCWARILNMNYVNGNMTSTIAWNLIASYYPSLPYFRDGLMTAAQPWSGHYVVDSPLWMTAHTTQFTEAGWTYLRQGAGVGNFTGGGSFVSLVSPDGKHLTIVIETMSHDHSVCIRPGLKPYNVSRQDVTLELGGTFTSIQALNVWYSKLDYGETIDHSVLFRNLGQMKVVQGLVSLTLGVDEVWTLTTLTTGQKGAYPTPPPSRPFPDKYFDDFEGYPEHAEPFNLAQQMGSWEIVDVRPPHNRVARQMVLTQPVYWCSDEKEANNSLSLVGSYNWMDVVVEVEVKLGHVNGSSGYFVAARVSKGGGAAYKSPGVFLYIFPGDNIYILSRDLERKKTMTGGKLGSTSNDWNKVALLVQGNYAAGFYNNRLLFNLSIPNTPPHGFVAMGTDTWGIADFDNLRIDASFSH